MSLTMKLSTPNLFFHGVCVVAVAVGTQNFGFRKGPPVWLEWLRQKFSQQSVAFKDFGGGVCLSFTHGTPPHRRDRSGAAHVKEVGRYSFFRRRQPPTPESFSAPPRSSLPVTTRWWRCGVGSPRYVTTKCPLPPAAAGGHQFVLSTTMGFVRDTAFLTCMPSVELLCVVFPFWLSTAVSTQGDNRAGKNHRRSSARQDTTPQRCVPLRVVGCLISRPGRPCTRSRSVRRQAVCV